MLAHVGFADRLAADVHGLDRLKRQAARNDPEAIRAAARQFEAMLLQTLLKDVRAARFTQSDDPLGDSETVRLYRELLDQQWVQRIVQGRGLGFAEKMAEQMLKAQAPAEGQAGASAASSGRSPAQLTGTMLNTAETDQAPGTMQPTAATGSVDPTPAATRKARFLQTMRPHAEAAARATGLPADFILAHAALESGWGEREIRGQDGRPSHNLFGIKAGGSWAGPSVQTQTTEYRHGLPVKQSDRFRAYADYTQAFSDYADLLMNRYGDALRAGADADAFAQALMSGGYATDPAYAGKLRAVIASVARMTA